MLQFLLNQLLLAKSVGKTCYVVIVLSLLIASFRYEGGCRVRYGLRSLDQYVVLEPIIMKSTTFGLPMRRQRVFLILLRLDVAAVCSVSRIYQNINIINSHSMNRRLRDNARPFTETARRALVIHTSQPETTRLWPCLKHFSVSA